MTFDLCDHKIRAMVVEFGKVLRKVQGLPEENNITILYQEALKAIGVPEVKITSANANHLPAPHEMKDEKGKLIIPRKDCPQCGRKEGLALRSICSSCTDSEGGKYHTMFSCEDTEIDRNQIKLIGCGFKTEKSEKMMTQQMDEENPNWRGGMKKDLGIETHTNNGLK